MKQEVEEVQNTQQKRYTWKKIAFVLICFDIIVINVSYLLALLLRFDFKYQTIPQHYYQSWLAFVPYHTIISIGIFWVIKLYKSIWSYVSVIEMERTLVATMLSSGVHFIGTVLFFERMPISYYLMGWIFEFITVTGIRYSYRFMRILKRRSRQYSSTMKNTMIIGGGEAGRALIKELINSEHLTTKVSCIIDDDVNKHGRFMDGVPIVGNRDDILRKVKEYDIEKIIFAIPTATASQKRDVLNICKETDCELQVLPGIYQLVNGEVSVRQLRKVSVEELLGRDSIKVNLNEIMEYVQDKTVMVTGGGGSIGSELCRQISSHRPKLLIIFEMYENNAYEIQQELKREQPDLNLTVLIGSVRDTKRMNSVFRTYRPDIVYHAAAHKHVPFMEDSPNEAIKNNVFGTYKTAMAASKYGVEKFVMISTDKAVNPTNVMGATKRICEMIIQALNKQTDTEFVAVRFGNVLGSNGSVIPLFKKQIEAGGPVTVTHPDIIRYFMTIPEAVSLVLQAGAYAKGGEIFVLDMGEPVKIDDLARNLIKLSGYTPDEDIKIEYTGLRPGEKLFEELLVSEEGLQTTGNGMIYVGKPIEMDYDVFLKELVELKQLADDDCESVKDAVARIVPTYVRQGAQSKVGMLHKFERIEEQKATVNSDKEDNSGNELSDERLVAVV